MNNKLFNCIFFFLKLNPFNFSNSIFVRVSYYLKTQKVSLKLNAIRKKNKCTEHIILSVILIDEFIQKENLIRLS